jgi:hypothetical protein
VRPVRYSQGSKVGLPDEGLRQIATLAINKAFANDLPKGKLFFGDLITHDLGRFVATVVDREDHIHCYVFRWEDVKNEPWIPSEWRASAPN